MTTENLETLTLTRLNELMVEAGHETIELLSSSFTELNASGEAQYEVTHFSPVVDGVAQNHVFVQFDLQDDIMLTFNPIEEGDLWLRRTEAEIAEEQAASSSDEGFGAIPDTQTHMR
jgi:hypothetical protein